MPQANPPTKIRQRHWPGRGTRDAHIRASSDPSQAAAAAVQASEAAAGLEDRRRLAAAFHVAGLAAAGLGRLETALDDLANAAALAKEVGDVYRLCAVTGFRGFVLLGADDAAGASAALVQAAGWAEKFGPFYLLPLFRVWHYAANQRLAAPQPEGLDGRSLERLAAMRNWPHEPWLGEPDFSLACLSRS